MIDKLTLIIGVAAILITVIPQFFLKRIKNQKAVYMSGGDDIGFTKPIQENPEPEHPFSDDAVDSLWIKDTSSVVTGSEYYQYRDGKLLYALTPDHNIVVGRGSDATVVISPKENTVSKIHFRLFFQDEHWNIEDLDSANGTYVNGKKLEPEKPCPLKVGDVIRAGMTEFECVKTL